MLDLGSKTNDDLPSLELLLKKILKSRKVHYKEEIDETPMTAPVAAPVITAQKEESEQDSHKHIPSSVTPVSSLSHYPESQTRLRQHPSPPRSTQRNPVVIVDETKSKNAATSPPTQSYISRVDRERKSFAREKKKDAKNRSSSSLLYSHNHRYHNGANASSCACATCSNNASWICPECFHSDHSSTSHNRESSFFIKPLETRGGRSVLDASRKEDDNNFMKNSSRRDQDASALFANDTSMIRPLADIVSDMDLNNGPQGIFASFVIIVTNSAIY